MARKKPIRVKQEQKVQIQHEEPKNDFILSKIDPYWGVLFVILLVTTIVRWNFISIPFERDEGTYTYFGQLVLDGKIPYIDFYEMKLPGIYYCYALIIAIFGATLEGTHIGFLVINLASVYFVFRATSKWFNPLTGLFAAISFAILSAAPHVSGFTTQSEHLVAFFLTAGLLVLFTAFEKEKWHLYFLSGALFCGSLLVKQNGIFFAFFGGLAVLGHYLLREDKDWKSATTNASIYTAGIAFPLLLVIGIITAQGAFSEFIYWIYEHPKAYVSGIDWDPQGKQLFTIAWNNITRNHFWFFALAFAGVVLPFFTKLSLNKKVMVVIFGLLSFLSVTPGLRFYGHYWLYMMPAVGIVGAAAMFGLQQILDSKQVKQAALIVCGLFGLLIVQHVYQQQNDEIIKDYYTNPDSMNVLRKVYGQNPFPESKIVGDYIKKNSTEEDRIAVFGSEPQIYFYSGRRGISKHNYCGYLVKDTPHHAEWQAEFIDDVEKAMPRYLVYFRHPVSWLAQPNTDRTIFSWFDKFANESYKLVGMTQVLSENQLASKFGAAEAMQLMQNVRQQEQNIRKQIQQLSANQQANQQQIQNLQNQLQVYNFEIILFERKEG